MFAVFVYIVRGRNSIKPLQFLFKDIYLSTKIFIPVQKYLFRYKNIFSSTDKYSCTGINIFVLG